MISEYIVMILIFISFIVLLELLRWLFDDKVNKKSSYEPELVPVIRDIDHNLQDVLKFDASGQPIQ